MTSPDAIGTAPRGEAATRRMPAFASRPYLRHLGALVKLSWPIMVSQFAVLGNGIADTIIAGHHAAIDLAVIGVGSGLFLTVFATLIGVLQGIAPIIAGKFGAEDHAAIGAYVGQGLWLALFLAVPGCLVLVSARRILDGIGVPAELAQATTTYLHVITLGLPPALLVRVYYAFTPAVDRPKPLMVINSLALLVKLPVSYALANGCLGLSDMGATGCAWGTTVMFWFMVPASLCCIARDPSYRRYRIAARRGLPQWRILRHILAVGVPIGAASLAEVASFTVMALFVARLGPAASAAHQIIANLAVVLFLVPLGLGIGIQILVAQSLGRKDPRSAREIAFFGIALTAATSSVAVVALVAGRGLLLAAYTSAPAPKAIALALLPLLAVYHIFDAVQGAATSALRGYQQTLIPTAVFLTSLWGIGLGGGWLLAFDGLSLGVGSVVVPPMGIAGIWLASSCGVALAGIALIAVLLREVRNVRVESEG